MLNPENLKILDPACGSGHILVEAYDILKDIYLERGYRLRDIPRLILEKNLYGIDIDDRAAQLAGFALLMKARADDRRILENPPKLNILALVESNDDWLVPSKNEALAPYFDQLITLFKHAKTFGSLIQIPSDLAEQLPALEAHLLDKNQDLLDDIEVKSLLPLVTQAIVLAMRYDAVVANPPYMGGKGMNGALKDFAKKHFPDSKSDLFAMFIERNLDLTKDNGWCAMITMPSWLFLSSFENLREKIINDHFISSLLHLGRGIFGIDFGSTAFVMRKNHIENSQGQFFRLHERVFQHIHYQDIAKIFLNSLKNKNYKYDFNLYRDEEGISEITGESIDSGMKIRYSANQNDFKKISGSPVAYWVSDKVRGIFENSPPLSEVADARQGLATADNDRFLRLWYEVEINRIGFGISNCEQAKQSKKKWFPYNKGGEFRKWYGNQDFVVNWENDGEEIRNFTDDKGKQRSRPQNTDYYFRPSISWSDVTSSTNTFRFYPEGFIYDMKGQSAFLNDLEKAKSLILVCNSQIITHLMPILNPTVSFQIGNFKQLPYLEHSGNDSLVISNRLIEIAKTDWNNYETSWDFTENPLIRQKQPTLKAAFEQWQTQNRAAIDEMKRLEEENNRLFIEAYGLQDELSPDVPEEQITLVRADREKDSVRLISYAIGCMMGRYSLDEAGLIYAHAGNVDFAPARYQTFAADDDGIVPLTDEFWFEDDAAQRLNDFLKTVWGAESLEKNKTWLAESIGQKTSETADETLRRYLASNFYKDHLQTYKKRPIYWCFSSGKQGAFQALVYLHRYNESTLARMRNHYVVPLMGRLQNRIEMLEKDRDAATSPASKNKIGKEIERFNKKKMELTAFDEKLRHYADMRISIDLDDGVKVNYGKFGDLLAEVKAVPGGAGDD